MGETPEIKATKFMEAAEKRGRIYKGWCDKRHSTDSDHGLFCPSAEIGTKAEV